MANMIDFCFLYVQLTELYFSIFQSNQSRSIAFFKLADQTQKPDRVKPTNNSNVPFPVYPTGTRPIISKRPQHTFPFSVSPSQINSGT